MTNFNIFDLSEQNLLPKENKSSANADLYRPDPKESKSGVYNSVIKFLPNPSDPLNKSVIKKWTTWLVNPLTGDGMQVDCPSTINEKSILQDTYFRLKKSNAAIDQENSKIFSRKQAMFSYIQILEDELHPELVGQVKIFRYGVQIFNKIDQEANPTNSYAQRNNVFDIFLGKPLLLKVKIKAGFNNYDDSVFAGVSETVLVEGRKMARNQEDMATIQKWFETFPDISKYEFKPWDEKTTSFVNECVGSVLDNRKIISTVETKPKLVETYAPANKVSATSSHEEEDDIDFDALMSDIHAH